MSISEIEIKTIFANNSNEIRIFLERIDEIHFKNLEINPLENLEEKVKKIYNKKRMYEQKIEFF